jgi:hypothetical protein
MRNARKWFLIGVAVLVIVIMAIVLSFIYAYNDPFRNYSGLDTHLAISPSDDLFYFTYFQEGNAAIYQSDNEGKNVKKVTID